MTQTTPLLWPAGQPRTRHPKQARFKLSLAKARENLLAEIGRLGGTLPVISSNAVLLKNGLPAARQPRNLDDTGVAVYFQYNRKPVVLACDAWDEIGANIQAIGLTVEAIRAMDRWGVSQMLDRAFAGFTALPPPKPEPADRQADHWKTVLGLAHSKVLTWSLIREAYLTKIKEVHPDRQGSNREAQIINAAYEEAKKAKGYK